MGEGLEGTSKPHLLATKIGAWQAYNHTVEDCLAEVRDNLRILRRDRVDVLLGHDMEQRRFWKPDAKEGEQLEIDESLDYEHAPVMQALHEAQAQGLCRYLGLSSNRSEPLAQVMQRVKLDMCLSANEYSLMDRRSPPVMLPVIREQGVRDWRHFFRAWQRRRQRRAVQGCAPHRVGPGHWQTLESLT